MLNSSLSPFKSTKINECIMRRRARNLRAKVKALLPVQICCKHDHRNLCVHQMQNNQRVWQSFTKRKKWITSQSKQNNYYFENEVYVDHQERFEKLTDSQIEQIKEDRLYYLGEENLNDFEEFLKNKSKPHLDQPIVQLISRALQNFQGFRFPSFQQNKPNEVRMQTGSLLEEQENNKSGFAEKRKLTVDEKQKEFEERRKVIEYQEKSKRLMNKVKMNMRLERAQIKLREIKQKKQTELSTKRQDNQMSLQKLTNRRRNYHHSGEIKELEEQLRKTFLNRKTKTAQQMSRTVRLQGYRQ